ncbi:hypothetical protein [Neptunicoccus sediminis]|uniref:hypothetical protein n=1 Tax=Neptunicoccus sediminis TaxID=1892596 RepID=UPI000846024C|nr:hypothetical protein [Neptunicoccus sediminis]
MTDSEKGENQEMLDVFFEASRAQDPVPGSDLMARILADASQVQAGFNPAPAVVSHPSAGQPGQTLLSRIFAVMGGWAGASALTASVCIGVLYGATAPDTVRSYLPALDEQTAELDYSYLGLLDETVADLEG